MQQSSTKRLLGCAIVLQISYLLLVRIGNWNTQIPEFLGAFFFSFLAYGVAARDTLNGRFISASRSVPIILISALLFRLTVLWCEPSLSEDFYRYMWDGRVQKSGLGPYDYPPRAPELEHLRDQNYARINHKEFKTPYPPAAEILFHAFARISTNPVIFKCFILFFDLLLIEVLRRLLIKEKLHVSCLILYAWNPLPIVEFAGSGHMDILSISLLLLTYLLVQNSLTLSAGIAFAFSALAKYLPLLALPWLLIKGSWRLILSSVVTGILLVTYFYTSDLRMLDGVLAYYKKWRFNDSLFGILYGWFGGAEPARIWGIFFTCLAAALAFAARFSFYRSAFMIFGTVILFSPVVHPWYICWVLPFLVFHPNKPWLFFSGWIVLAYLIRLLYPDTVWQPVLWLKLLIYLPFYFLLLTDLFKRSTVKTGLT